MAFIPTPRSLGELVAETDGAELVHGDASTCVFGLTHDTRRLERGDLFVAVPGLERDGLEFVPEAISRGAAAIATERLALTQGDSPSTPVIVLKDARRGLADLSAAFYGDPSKHLPVVGITGTDGKTSTTQLLSSILEAHGLRTGWLTTVNTKIAAELRPNAADHTTPEAPVVQRVLAEMLAAKLDVALLESSSHALALERVRGTHFKVGVFTNLSPEHINFHGSFEAYRAAKSKLFEMLPPSGLAVLNADDPSHAALRAATCARVLTYGVDASADFMAGEVRLTPRGTTFTLLPADIEVQTRLVGRFNVSNWMGAYAAATELGATADDLVRAAAAQPPVPGRMNLVEGSQPFTLVIDFAHTPQALKKALDTVRSLLGERGRVLLGFGMAGGRDSSNRPIMGALAANNADFFVITMDDPGAEDAADIAQAIAAGACSSGAQPGVDFGIQLDRRAAIRRLFEMARPGDAVLLAGKGHEQRMVVGSERRPWNDARVSAEVLTELGFRTQAVP